MEAHGVAYLHLAVKGQNIIVAVIIATITSCRINDASYFNVSPIVAMWMMFFFQCESAANGDLVEEEEDPNMLLLMRHLDKKTRKISFLKDHVNHLTEELHRKSKSATFIFIYL